LLPPPQPVIVVTGNAQLEATPDEATVRLGVTRQATTAQTAQEQANVAARDILSALQKLNISPERIQTSRLSLSPVYPPRPDNNEAPKIVAYSASNIISVELYDLTAIGPVIDAGLKSGANRLDGVMFRLRDDREVRERALREAVTEARRKAEVIADALGVRLGNPLEVQEGGVRVVPRGEAYGGVALRVAAEATPTPVSPGQMDVTADVTLRYVIDGLR
jgi:uncharacterized protein YggE